MPFALLTDVAASITELKRNPMRVIREGAGEAVVVLHRNKPAFYAVPPALYKAMLDVVENAQLAEGACARRDESTGRTEADGPITPI